MVKFNAIILSMVVACGTAIAANNEVPFAHASLHELVQMAEAANNGAKDEIYRRYGLKGDAQFSDEANRWVKQQAEAGHPDAQYVYALQLYHVYKDFPVALSLFTKSSNQRSPAAQRFLGYWYMGKADGTSKAGLNRDVHRGISLLKLAAPAGFDDVQRFLGVTYAGGLHGTAKDEKEAAKWLLMSAQQGNAASAFRIGHLYGNSEIIGNWAEAYRWTLIAERLNFDGKDWDTEDPANLAKNMRIAYSAMLTVQQLNHINAEVAAWQPKPTPVLY